MPDVNGNDKGVGRNKNGDESEVPYNGRGWTEKKQHVMSTLLVGQMPISRSCKGRPNQ